MEMELYGFKSFAKRTRIRFSDEITAVVGPNGSGKSNIVDAIMWALGESSARQLRGNTMEDIIFSGTDRHKPVNFAEVVLTFDNRDGFFSLPYEEISVGRKYFRSGESQYFLNKKRVRQKDVRELFLDTGIGKNGYSFIGQGQIDEILSTRSEDRRSIFEEAAGISKYKWRKEESLRNLKRTEEHLDRIEDIYAELMTHREEIEEKKEKAERFSDRKEIWEKIHYVLTKKELDALEAKRRQYNEEKIHLEKKIHVTDADIADAEKMIEEESSRLRAFSASEENAGNRRVEAIRTKESIAGNRRDFASRTAYLTTRRDTIDTESKALREKYEEAERLRDELVPEIEERTRQLEEKSDALEKSTKKRRELEEELGRHSETHRMVSDQREKHLDEIHTKTSRIEALTYLLKENNARVASLKKRITFFEAQSKEIGERKASFARELRTAQKARAELETELEQKEQNAAERFRQLQAWDKELMSYESKRNTISGEIQYLERMSKNHEGFQYAVKEFLKRSSFLPFSGDIIGPVADHLEIEEKYTLAVSTALGLAGQNIVLKTDAHISEVLKYLREQKLGRITFLPLNTLTPRSVESGLKNRSAVPFRIASECVRCDDRLCIVAENLLGRILIAEDAQSAKQLARDLKYRYRIVTVSGDVFQTGGGVTGGRSRNNDKELYNRNKAIEALQEDLAAVEGTMDETQARKARYAKEAESERETIDALRAQKAEIEAELRALEEKQIGIRGAETRSREQLDGAVAEAQKEEEAVRRYAEEKEDLEEQRQEIQRALSALPAEDEEKSAACRKELDQWIAREADGRVIRQESLSVLQESKLKAEQAEYALEELEQRMRHSLHEQESVERELADLEKKDLEEAAREADADAALSAIEGDLEENRENIRITQEKIENLRAERESIWEEKSVFEKQMVRIESALENAEAEWAEKAQRFQNTEAPEIDDALKEQSVATLRRRQKELKRELDSIGPVDPDAKERYDAWKERTEFLSAQREDLILSKEKLETIIRDMDREMRKQLEQAVQRIDTYFHEIFKDLFQGGTASIHWEEGDILEAGIGIRAQPPGKKLQSLSLLSGGERAMTAVALLFALLRFRKSPFCIVDEIDAALDEANIRRYSRYVQTIEDIQFIMITHRKPTMEMANEIYGVTMEEKGISRILFLQLEEVDIDARVAQEKDR